jgi:hypothetical protein
MNASLKLKDGTVSSVYHSNSSSKSNSKSHYNSVMRNASKEAKEGHSVSVSSVGSDVELSLFLEGGFDAIVTIATGSFSAMRLVSALRDARVGDFEKPIFVLTDKVNSTSKELDGYNVTLVDITHYKPSFESIQASQAWENATITKVKWFKTQLFSLIPAHNNAHNIAQNNSNEIMTAATTDTSTRTTASETERTTIDNLLYIDADEIINSPIANFETAVMQSISISITPHNHNNAPFQSVSSNLQPQPQKCSAYFFPERLYISQSVNSGTALYFRNISQRLLSEWSLDIISGKYDRDQIALDATLERNIDSIRVCTFPSRHNFFSADFVTLVWNVISLGRRRKGATFIHPCSTKDTSSMATPFDPTIVSNHRL